MVLFFVFDTLYKKYRKSKRKKYLFSALIVAILAIYCVYKMAILRVSYSDNKRASVEIEVPAKE